MEQFTSRWFRSVINSLHVIILIKSITEERECSKNARFEMFKMLRPIGSYERATFVPYDYCTFLEECEYIQQLTSRTVFRGREPSRVQA